MKTLSLITVILVASMAHANATTYAVLCQVPSAQKVSVTFEGMGTVTMNDDGTTTAKMNLDIKGPGVKSSFEEFYTGRTQTIPAGQFMPKDSYSVQLLAEHVTDKDGKPMSLRMFLGGPKAQASSHLVLDNAEYHSNCDIYQF